MFMAIISSIVVLLLLFLLSFACVVTVPQGHVMIITQFGKYHKIMHAGFNVKAPWQKKYMTRLMCILKQRLFIL